jgi:hypothetical protein
MPAWQMCPVAPAWRIPDDLRRTYEEQRGWRETEVRRRRPRLEGASEAGVAGVATVLQQAEAGGELATLPASRAGGPGAEAPPGSPEALRQTPAVGLLIAIEDRHRVYREAIGEFLRSTRPRLEVRLASPRGLHAGPAVPVPDR